MTKQWDERKFMWEHFLDCEKNPNLRNYLEGWKPKYTEEELQDRFERFLRKEAFKETGKPISEFIDYSDKFPIKQKLSHMNFFWHIYLGIVSFGVSVAALGNEYPFIGVSCLILLAYSMYHLATNKFDLPSGGGYVVRDGSYQVNSLTKYQEDLRRSIEQSHIQAQMSSLTNTMNNMIQQQANIANKQEFYLREIQDPYSCSNKLKEKGTTKW